MDEGKWPSRVGSLIGDQSSPVTITTLLQRTNKMSTDNYQFTLEGSKDDASQQALLFTRQQISCNRRRSASQPPPHISGGKTYYGSRFADAYLHDFLIHLCPCDSRRRICVFGKYDTLVCKPTVDVRSCCAGSGLPCDPWTDNRFGFELPLRERLGLQCVYCATWQYGDTDWPRGWNTREEAKTWRCKEHETWAT